MAFCGLTEDEIDAIAEHEQVPEIVAAEIGAELLKTSKGIFEIKGFILDNLEKAKLAGKTRRRNTSIACTPGFTRLTLLHGCSESPESPDKKGAQEAPL